MNEKIIFNEILANMKEQKIRNKNYHIGQEVYYYGHSFRITNVLLYTLTISNNIYTKEIDKQNYLYKDKIELSDEQLNIYLKYSSSLSPFLLRKQQIFDNLNIFLSWTIKNIISIYNLSESDLYKILNINSTTLPYIIRRKGLSINFIKENFNNLYDYAINDLCKFQELNDEFIEEYIKYLNIEQISLLLKHQKNISIRLENKLKILSKLI